MTSSFPSLTDVVPRVAQVLLLSALLSACGSHGSGGGDEAPASPATPAGLSTTPAVSTSGTLTLEQYDRDARPTAPISRSTRYTLMPEGATP